MVRVRESGPPLPDALERHWDTSAGRIRSRSVGEPCPGVPEVVLVQGMAVADYLMPALAELGRFLRDRIEESVPELTVPLLVIRGADDRLSTAEWAQGLAAAAPSGRYQELPGAHTFLWADPGSWSAHVRQLAVEAT
jgi:pimeloyl-ACP methyl ester carboxylesterase